jgi:cytochrome b subunit of formate dehydrogenase
MGSGRVDLNWARQHHVLWVEELERKRALPAE